MTAAPTPRTLPLQGAAAVPLYRQVYERVREAIASGALQPGDRIPSVRALMQELGLSRGTIDTAYALLAAEGYVQARGQAGTIVAPDLQPRRPVATAAAPSPPATPSFRPDSILPFQMGLPALDAFPRKIWARLGARQARALQPAGMAHPAVAGLSALRAEIATYLHMARGIQCTPEQVFVTSGYRHTLGLVAQALLQAGDRVWVEDPGYPPTRELLGQLRMEAVPVPVDPDGLVVARGLQLAPRARAAVVTPAHQSPLCVALSLPRRQALLDWAARQGAWIVEDDYDGEYRYVSRPLPALKSLDRDGRVLYAGTFSKLLFPGLRLAYLVVPPPQVERFERIAHIFAGGSPELTQSIVAAFMAEGHFARHIQRMRRLYAERRALTQAGLERMLGPQLRIAPQPGGMHLVLRLQGGQSGRGLVARMRADGLSGEALADWTARDDAEPVVLLNFTNIASQARAEELARRMLRLL